MDELRHEILKLEKHIVELKLKLFNDRLLAIIDSDLSSISNICIKANKSEWCIDYQHTTDIYSENNYAMRNNTDDDDNDDDDININMNPNMNDNKDNEDNDSVSDEVPYHRTTKVTFGFNTEEYVNLNYIETDTPHDSIFQIYKHKKTLRIINNQYSTELMPDEQIALITKYSNNVNIPEWLALKVYLHMIEHEWTNSNMIVYLSIV